MKLALFDLDHTLLPIDCNHAWRSFENTMGWGDSAIRKQQYDEYFRQYNAGVLNMAEYIHFVVELILQQGEQVFINSIRSFIEEEINKHIKPVALNLIEQHRKTNEQIIIITASNELITRPIADVLGVDELIAIELERNSTTGWITGGIKGEPPFREGKVNRLLLWLKQRGLTWDDVQHSTFYTDSINDLPLLELVHQPIAVNPDSNLRNIAQQRGWQIKDIFDRE